jgi:hypothetical protein
VCDIDGTVQMRDKDEMRSRYEQAFRSGISAEVVDRVRAGAWIVDHERVKRGDGGVREFLVVYEVDDGLIRRMIALPG